MQHRPRLVPIGRAPAACDWNGDGVIDHFVEDMWRLQWVDGNIYWFKREWIEESRSKQ